MKQKKPEAAAKFTAKQLAALPLLLDGKTGVEVAKAISVQASTVSNWLNHSPAFRSELERLRKDKIDRASLILDSVTLDAALELRRLISSAKSETVRLRACELFLERVPLASPPQQVQQGTTTLNLPLLLKALGVPNA